MGVIARAGFQWLILVALAALGSTEEVGKLTAPLALAGLAFVFFGFGMRNVYLTHIDRLAIGWYVYTRVILLTVAALITLVTSRLLDNYMFTVVALVCLTKFTEAIADILLVADQEGGRQGLAGIVLSALGLGSATGFISGYLISGSLVVGQLGWLFSSVVVTSLYFWYVRRTYREQYFTSEALPKSRVLTAGLQTGAAQASVNAQSSLPILLLNQSVTAAEVGIFSLIFYFITIYDLGASGYQQQALPKAVKERGDGPHTKRFALILVSAAVFYGTVVAAAGPWLMDVVYRVQENVPHFAFWVVGGAIVANSLSIISGMKLAIGQLYRLQMYAGLLGTLTTVVYCFAIGDGLNVPQALVSVALGFLVRAGLNSLGMYLVTRGSKG